MRTFIEVKSKSTDIGLVLKEMKQTGNLVGGIRHKSGIVSVLWVPQWGCCVNDSGRKPNWEVYEVSTSW